ncbi:hypothetical protein ABWH88_08280 [Marinobacter adhaerens]|uniref:hypothetical protein n=1 Tax=Marinobacter adhaerens TaxID=1033846 RepID=UPI0035D02C77
MSIVGGVVPKEYIHCGSARVLQEQMQNGCARPAIRCWTYQGHTLYDGSYHDVDSNEMAFKIAASMGNEERRPQGGSGHCSSRS